LLHQEFPIGELTTALEEALGHNCLQATAVRQLLLNQTAPAPPEPIAVPDRLARLEVPTPDLSRYNLLLAEVAR
jgi:hypothetical protein